MADVRHDGEGALRATDTLLRGTGGRVVLLRMSMAAAGDDETEQIGLSTPGFNDVELAPCVFRKTGSRSELLVSAVAVQQVVGSLAFDSAAVLFKNAVGVVVGDFVLEIESVAPVESMGITGCYRLRLRAAAAW